MADVNGGAGDTTVTLTKDERAALAAASPALSRIFRELQVAPARPAAAAAAKHTANLLNALTYAAAGIIASTTVIAGSVVASLAAVLPAEDQAGAYEALYLEAFGALLEALACLLLAATVAVIALQVLRWLNKSAIRRGAAWIYGGVGAVALSAVVLGPGYLATEAAKCAAVALSLELPNATTLDEIEVGGPFWCRGEFSAWDLEPGSHQPPAAGQVPTPPAPGSAGGTTAD